MNRKQILGIALLSAISLVGCQKKDASLMVATKISANWTFHQADKEEWLPATVPGCVHTDLLANGKIEDPFYRLNEHKLQWIDKVNWEYKTTFNIDPDAIKRDRIALDFKGLDTYADVFVNGTQVLSADNMFREWLVDVKPQVKEGANELRILFRSPIIEGLKKYDANGYVIPVSDNDQAINGEVPDGKMVSVYTRKAGYHFGWDWGPRLVSSGLWRPVYLTVWDDARIENLQLKQNSVSEKEASLTAVFEIEANAVNEATVTIQNDGNELARTNIKLTKGISTYPVDFKIENPKLWWTNGLGEAHLYNIKGKLEIGKRITEKSERIGIRTLQLVRDKDANGTSFYFKLNGVPVFMKGANYIPNDVFPARVTDEMYQKVINTSKISNFNMLRIWGGGIYENDRLYDLCDQNGILVWQDFMFACAMFPGDDAFLENVKQEAADNIKRMRNHPSIAMWCGNNEILAAWFGWGWKQKEEAKSKENADKIWKSYTDIFHHILPDAVATYDPGRSYWDSSPCAGMGNPSDLNNGDDHYWGVWWGKDPFKMYATHIARFMSEYGFQSFPEMKTVKQYATPEDYDIFSEVMKSHQRSSIGNGTIEYYMLQDYKKPKNFESFLYVNHVLQAEGIKFALEGHRRAAPFCMGSLVWQINDCWPVASWSSTDYYQRWKALQYFAKKGFEPVLVSPYTNNDSLKVDIINDKLSEIKAQLVTKVLDFDGKEIWKETKDVTVPANSSNTFFGTKNSDFMKNIQANKQLFVVELVENNAIISTNTLYFKPIKDVLLPKPDVKFEINAVQDGFEISLSTDKLAKNLYMTIGDEEGFFSDNYFDLIPAQPVKIKLETKLTKEKLQEVFAIQTLDGAF
ncbi:beta-mannosidase [Aquipluma nitroreducens]|uniref:Beta-mannosidase n=1 Tax=Aquipluma nitroreducens TaxID=2010828 RepID=A0A5K7SAH8_9BACT|nr:glycoside hydrolase family 2 protein [Aquipluma nitroreducens]BBE18515.1 beta-mannosidase [Aquipluma nitroreducens]